MNKRKCSKHKPIQTPDTWSKENLGLKMILMCPFLSSDNESAPSETTLDDICESLEGPGQDVLGGDLSSPEGRHLPIWFCRVGGFQHNSSSIGFCHTLGEFPGVIRSIVSRNTVPVYVDIFAECFHTMPLRRDRFHIGTLHCAEAR